VGSVILSDILWIVKSKCHVYHSNYGGGGGSASDDSYCTLLRCRLHSLTKKKSVMRSAASAYHQRFWNFNKFAARKDITLPTFSTNFQAV
jgi:hypothetical protein